MNCLRLPCKKIEILEKEVSFYKLQNTSAYLFRSIPETLLRNVAMKLNEFIINTLKRSLYTYLKIYGEFFLTK